MAQKDNKIRREWVKKVIYWELCKQLNLGYTDEWFMYRLESILENETPKIHKDFPILAKWLDLL